MYAKPHYFHIYNFLSNTTSLCIPKCMYFTDTCTQEGTYFIYNSANVFHERRRGISVGSKALFPHGFSQFVCGTFHITKSILFTNTKDTRAGLPFVPLIWWPSDNLCWQVSVLDTLFTVVTGKYPLEVLLWQVSQHWRMALAWYTVQAFSFPEVLWAQSFSSWNYEKWLWNYFHNLNNLAHAESCN